MSWFERGLVGVDGILLSYWGVLPLVSERRTKKRTGRLPGVVLLCLALSVADEDLSCSCKTRDALRNATRLELG